MISGLAFFDYDEEIATYCSTNLTPASEWVFVRLGLVRSKM